MSQKADEQLANPVASFFADVKGKFDQAFAQFTHAKENEGGDKPITPSVSADTLLPPTSERDSELDSAPTGGRKLIVCVDGTWQAPGTMFDAESKGGVVQTPVIVPSNIVKIAYALGGADYPSHARQLVYYHAGVATETDAEDKEKTNLQGMFGNIDEHILDVYAWLAKEYKVGDEICAFGFSRGSTIVRSLFSFIRYVGLVKYEKWSIKAKEEFSKDLHEAYNIYKMRDDDAEGFKRKAEEFKANECHPSVALKFIGVFDTVQALDIPEAYTASKLLTRMAQASGKISENDFHDLRIGAEVDYAYHAISLDECREYFPPTLFEAVAEDVKTGIREQKWFRGSHADVGGGFFEQGLADISLDWMLSKARHAGLSVLHDQGSFEAAQKVFLMGMSAEQYKKRKDRVIHDAFKNYPDGNSPYGKKIPRDLSLYMDHEKFGKSELHESCFHVPFPLPPQVKQFFEVKFPDLLEKFINKD